MKHKKIVLIALVICVISVGVYIMYDDHRENIAREREANFHEEAIEMFWDNENLFEQVKEHFLALPTDAISYPALSVTIYYDSGNDCIRIANQDQGWYENLVIEDEFEQHLLSLAIELRPMLMYISYYPSGYDVEGVEKKIIKFQLYNGISPKGVIYREISNEEEITEKLQGFAASTHLKGNWYYYEEVPGV